MVEPSTVEAVAESSTYENSGATKATNYGYAFVRRTMGEVKDII